MEGGECLICTWGKVSNITENLFSVANQPVEDVEEQVLDRNADVLTTGIFNLSILQMPTNDWYGEGGWCATFCTTSGYAPQRPLGALEEGNE